MLAVALLLLPFVSAVVPQARHDPDHSHETARQLPSKWYHDEEHPVHELFRRGAPTDGATYAAVGSDAWGTGYPDFPPAHPDTSKLPAAWVAALNDAIARKAIPNIPVSTIQGDSNPTYAGGLDPNGPEVCSATEQCRIPGDIWDAPPGTLGLSFDDGPEAGTESLLAFLDTQKQQVTHFMIGSNILGSPDDFLKAFNRGDDIAVHTWTHPMMTTQSNLEVVAEIGWTMQIIHNSTGGRVPKFWRPPYGDTDTRVSAIAKEVFGLTTIIWNQDTADWSLTDSPPGTSAAAIKTSMQKWLTGSKTPGLIILEHELSTQSVASFIAAYPVMQQNKWDIQSLAQLMGGNASYFNSASNSSPVVAADVLGAKNATAPPASGSSSASAAGPSGTTGGKNATSNSNANANANANANNNAKNGTQTVSSAGAGASGKSSASPRWATAGPSVLLAAAVLLLLWS
ncbi:carbohydrate esterase family 4 protein [Mycena alexandri]|uniref:chitin deacetylase n=1 Tax=Mycena alexandri TaxID=1745969 RepID=A0AAD6SRL5_9AGAR|nr:carbohydrate esterase family 4 protein [Mycena alexandri]